jgi:serine/threonine protein kinase
VFTSNRNCYIVTELCNQGDLESNFRKRGQINETEIRQIVADVYKGLDYLASKGIVHRDLKIANVFQHNGVAKIADFGFAVYSKYALPLVSLNFKDLSIGSPLYMSPEGFLKNTYGPKTDVWSFGVMVYELYHKKTPYSRCSTEKELKSSILKPIKYEDLKIDIPHEAK